ncbi:hypothetical protein [Arthrobacter sp.]|uniref:hypothetical protein n=1 Tax=Arthrobacter sp. TaxID=1667 RepID=UPI0026E06CA0|nr:hypothetical protein [Arthrobacter sp.]MDO5751964.1 hypothetical protein [Arthrobacter sp.]
MAGSVWVLVTVGVFALVVVVLVVLLLVGRFSSKGPDKPFESPQPRPRGEAIPPTGSR